MFQPKYEREIMMVVVMMMVTRERRRFHSLALCRTFTSVTSLKPHQPYEVGSSIFIFTNEEMEY